jgi:hypothetical protein
MTMTSSESQWIARVMRTISYVAFVEPCNTATEAMPKSAGEDFLRAARSLSQILKRGDGDCGTRPLAASREMLGRNEFLSSH